MTMKAGLTLLCVAMLLLSGARLAILGRDALGNYRLSRSENALVPRFGSFDGVIAEGDEIRPNLLAGDHLLVFTIHRERIGGDVQFWNGVMAWANQANLRLAARLRYWGICDSGAECNQYQSKADFPIVGFLEPFEMRTVAEADGKDEALLYDDHDRLVAEMARAAGPAAEANLVLQKAR